MTREPCSVRFSPAERQLFDRAAEREGVRLTTFLREAGVQRATEVLANGDGDDSGQPESEED